MIAPTANHDDDNMTLGDLGVAGLFDDDALADAHGVSRAPFTPAGYARSHATGHRLRNHAHS